VYRVETGGAHRGSLDVQGIFKDGSVKFWEQIFRSKSPGAEANSHILRATGKKLWAAAARRAPNETFSSMARGRRNRRLDPQEYER